MAKLCAKGKAAAKRKFKVYPSAYANMYAAGVCSGRIKPKGTRKKRKYLFLHFGYVLFLFIPFCQK